MKFKTFIFSLFCLFFTLEVKSQLTINRENYFTLGNLYPYYYLDNIKFDSVAYNGNNCIWDLSNGLNSWTYDTLFAIDPSGTVFYNEPLVNYSLSNLCLYTPNGQISQYDDSMYTYLIANPDSIYFLGNWAYNGLWETAYFHLTDFELFLPFPFSFGNSFIDTFSGSAYDFSGWGLCPVSGTREVEVEGVGQLILPGITYDSVLKIKSHRMGMWNCGFGNSFNYTYYTFFDLNLNGPILEVSTSSSFVQEVIYFYNNPLVSSITELNNHIEVEIYPNPTIDKLYIKTKSVSPFYELVLVNATGEQILNKRLMSITGVPIEVNLEKLASGIYQLRLTNSKECIVKTIIKI